MASAYAPPLRGGSPADSGAGCSTSVPVPVPGAPSAACQDIDPDLTSWLVDLVQTNGTDDSLFELDTLPELDKFVVNPGILDFVDDSPYSDPPAHEMTPADRVVPSRPAKRMRTAAVTPTRASPRVVAASAPPPAATQPTNTKAKPNSKKRRRPPGTSTGAERRRRAQHDKLMGALKELVYPEESEHDDSSSTSSSSSAIVRRTSKRKGPTKAQILEAAVNLIKELRRAAPTQSISVPFELLPKPGARDLALGGAASIGGPLAECPIAEQRRVGVDIFRHVVNVFQRPSHRETIRELHRLVIGNDPCNPHAMPRLLSSVQRVSMPVVVETCANYGLYVRLTPKEFDVFFRRLWNFPEIRRMWGEMWMLWLAPTTATVPESLQLAPETIKVTLKKLWEYVTTPSVVMRFAGLLRGATCMPDACTRTSPMICDMWLSACKSLGFPCTVEGIARLHRAAYVCDDPETVGLSFRTLSAVMHVLKAQVLPQDGGFTFSCHPVAMMKAYASGGDPFALPCVQRC